MRWLRALASLLTTWKYSLSSQTLPTLVADDVLQHVLSFHSSPEKQHLAEQPQSLKVDMLVYAAGL